MISLALLKSRLARLGLFAIFITTLLTMSTARPAGATVDTSGIQQTIMPGQTPEGLTSNEWQHIQNNVTAAEYNFAWHQADKEVATPYYWAPNRTQGWGLVFTEQGTQVTPRNNNESWQWGLTLSGYGYEGAVQPVINQPTISTKQERLTYRWDSNLSEWWINNPAGLEQGFSLQERPQGGNNSPLILQMEISGNLIPAQNGEAILFQDSSGETILSYDRLYVTDATGRQIPAYLKLNSTVIQIVVEDANAIYPLLIDPWTQTAKLTASDGAGFDQFGYSVAISGDTVVVGAAVDDVGVNTDQGSAYVFVRPGGGWATATETAKLTASDGAASDTFGVSVAVSGDTVVVGAYRDDVTFTDQGSAYIFVRPGGGWATANETAKLTASDGVAVDKFGVSVAISGDTVVVGAYLDNVGANNQGSAYVFVRPGGGWISATDTAKLTASDGAASDNFGISVAISGDTVVVGAYLGNVTFLDQGSAYVFVRPGGGWISATETAKLTASDGAIGDYFGRSVAVSGDTVVVGAYKNDVGASNQGSAYVFVRPGGGWISATYTAKLTASDGAISDYFGYSVAISGDTVVVGAYWDDVGVNTDQGSAYVFVRPGGGWATATETAKLTASDGATGDNFGISVAVSGDTVVVGAYRGNSSQGSAYIVQNNFCSKTTGNWSSTTSWVGGVAPGSTDDVCISSGDTITLTGAGAANRVLVNPDAILDMSTFALTAEDTVINNGTISQTLTVNSASVPFMQIQNIAASATKYRGVNVDSTTNAENLGAVTVGIRETIDWFSPTSSYEYCTTNGSSSPVYAERCYTINPTTAPTLNVTVRLWGLTNELNGIAEGSLSVYHLAAINAPWGELTIGRFTGNDAGSYSYAEGELATFSPFVLGATGSTPTAISLRSFSTGAGTSSGLLIAVSMVVLLSLALVWRRR